MSDVDLGEALALLERLVAFDTQNPPRAIDGSGLFAFLAAELRPAGLSVDITDLGEGCVSLLAVRGAPRALFNVHMDTVPADPRWARDPHRLAVEEERAIGLGACDTKGAAACLLAAARRTTGPLALLFTSDEEAGSSRCVRAFLEAHGRRFDPVIVAEPTGCRAVLEHRGIATCTGEFRGEGGHASSARALDDSALHEAVRWASRALAYAEESEARRYKDLQGIRFNLGVLQGGTKANMIASTAAVRFGARPLPDQEPEALIAAIASLAPRAGRVAWTRGFLAPPLRGGEVAEATVRRLRLLPGPAVDFWTEAALFAEAGAVALVYGPGDIAQAHTAGEWVALAALAEALGTYRRLIDDPE
jgi:acetylornithine deacetylase